MVKKILSILFLSLLMVFPCVGCGNNDTESSEDSVTQSSIEQECTVTLDKTEITLFVGQTQVLTATVKPISASGKPRRWRSSDGTVATVDGTGAVVTKKEGVAIITVTVDGVSAQCTVTVVSESVE